jgi:hypothetical protein
MKNFVVYNREQGRENGLVFSGNDPEKVQEDFLDMIDDINDDVEDEDDKVSIFDYVFAVEEVKDINEEVTDYNTARQYLGGKANKQFTVTQKAVTLGNTVPSLVEVTHLVDALNPAHVEALIALNELFTIAQAWNMADDFTPDYSNRNQDKWFPWFVYDKDRAGFVSAYSAPSPASAYFGSRLCFKTANRARQFGEQFIDLWNKVLLLNA